MATYSITEDKKFPWVSLITITCENEIDVSSDIFNITVKDQLEYFISDYIKNGSTFELEELFKKDTQPTLEISNKSTVYDLIRCFTCGGKGTIVCPKCNGKGYYYLPYHRSPTMCEECRDPEHPYSKGLGYVKCPECGGEYPAGETDYSVEKTVCTDEFMYTETYQSNILNYLNSDDWSLVRNGIQFWIDGITKKTLYIRVAAKGKSSTNASGYKIWNPVGGEHKSGKYEYTCNVGFTVANFNITLNDKERLVFDCFLIPKIKTGDPIPYEYNPEETDLSAYVESAHMLSGAFRTDYDWNGDGLGKDNLFVNNTTDDAGNYSMIYEQYPTLIIDSLSSNWKTSAYPDTKNYNVTPLYIVKSSAYLNDYLVEGSAWDLLSAELTTRNMTVDSANLKSYLYNDYTMKKLNLKYDVGEPSSYPYNVVQTEDNESISSMMYCYEITQYIEDSSCSGILRQNQVKLDWEI